MFIQTEQTPNPATLKFLPGCAVMTSGTANFTSAEAARISPLAERLFSLPEVTGVFLGADFVTVTKSDEGDWYRLKPAILAVIMEHFTAGRPVLLGDAAASAAAATSEEDEDEVVAQIKELLETRVRPAVAQDGGDIIFHDFEDGVVYLAYAGLLLRMPELDRDLEGGHREYASALHPGGGRGARGLRTWIYC